MARTNEQSGSNFSSVDNGLFIDNEVLKLGAPLIEDTAIDIDGNNLTMSGIVGSSSRQIGTFMGEGIFGFVDGYVISNTYNDGTDDYNFVNAMGDFSSSFGTPLGKSLSMQSATSLRQILELNQFDDANGNQNPAFTRILYNSDQSIAQFFNMNSNEISFGYFSDDGTDVITSSYKMDSQKAVLKYDFELSSGEQRKAEVDLTQTYARLIAEHETSGRDIKQAYFDAVHNNGVDMEASMVLNDQSTGVINDLTLTETGLSLLELPAYDDDTAAGAGGLSAGDFYETTGSGAAPLNVAGIVMRKQ